MALNQIRWLWATRPEKVGEGNSTAVPHGTIKSNTCRPTELRACSNLFQTQIQARPEFVSTAPCGRRSGIAPQIDDRIAMGLVLGS